MVSMLAAFTLFVFPTIIPTATAHVPTALSPLGGVWLENVRLDDGSDAFVSVPVGATTARPIVVAIHGAVDRPDWACSEWRGATDGYSFIVCPRGSAYGQSFVWSSIAELERQAVASVAAVRAKYGAYVAAGPAIYASFSQGSQLAPYVVARHADLFPVIALDEGGYASTAGPFGAAFARAGGKRALLACSTYNCENDFAASARSLPASGIDTRVSKLGTFGHTMDGRALTALHEQWKWLVRDDPRWTGWTR
jgi:hypothetical protein